MYCTVPCNLLNIKYNIEPRYEISKSVISAPSKASDQHAHTHSLIRAFGNRLNI